MSTSVLVRGIPEKGTQPRTGFTGDQDDDGDDVENNTWPLSEAVDMNQANRTSYSEGGALDLFWQSSELHDTIEFGSIDTPYDMPNNA